MSLRNVFIFETTGNIVRMLGLPHEMAQKFTDMFPKADFALAKAYMLWADASGYSKEYAIKPDYFRHLLARWRTEQGNDLMELLKKQPALEKKVNSAKTYEDILSLVIPSGGKGEVLFDLGDGWKWVKLASAEHSLEARWMQHCASDGRGELVSLRDDQDKPHVTMTYNPKENIVYQIKGKQNVAPIQKYWPAITTFFQETKANIKDGFIKGKAKDLYYDLKTAGGHEVIKLDMSRVEAEFARRLASTAAKQWLWIVGYDMVDADNYEDAEGGHDTLNEIFKKSGYQMLSLDAISGNYDVFLHPSYFKAVPPKGSQELLDAIPTFEQTKTEQGMALYYLAKKGKVSDLAQTFDQFGRKHAQEFDPVYKMMLEVFGSENVFNIERLLDQNNESGPQEYEYDDMVGIDGAAGNLELTKKARLRKRWKDWFYSTLSAAGHSGGGWGLPPEERRVRDDFVASIKAQMNAGINAGNEPPEFEPIDDGDAF